MVGGRLVGWLACVCVVVPPSVACLPAGWVLCSCSRAETYMGWPIPGGSGLDRRYLPNPGRAHPLSKGALVIIFRFLDPLSKGRCMALMLGIVSQTPLP